MRSTSLPGKILAAATCVALASAPLFAGVVFEVETTYHSGGRAQSSQMSVEGKNMNMEISSGESASSGAPGDEVIFRGDRRQMVVVNHRDKAYMVIDNESVKKLGGQVSGQMQQAMKEMEKRLEQMDPKQREMVEKMMKGRMPGAAAGAGARREPSEYRRTSERATHQGYPCVKYDVWRGGEKVRELWVTDWGNVKGSQEMLGVFKDMAAFYSELMESIGQMAGGFGGVFDADNPIESWTKVDGFPVVTRSFEGGELESETALRSVTERDLDPDAFEPPKGYRLRTMGPQ